MVLLIPISLLNGQKDGQIISKEKISKDSLISIFSGFKNPDRFISSESGKPDWSPAFKIVDSTEMYGIEYWSDGLRVNGFYLQPKAPGKYPCVIYNRGGNRDFGMLTPARVNYLGGDLSRAGFVVIFSNYRGVDGGEGVEEFGGADVNDVLNLIPALAQLEKADTSKIGMYGWSRGGMMTYLALTKTNRIKAAAVGGAVSDCFENIKDRPEMETNVMAELIPDYEENKEAELTKRSAVRWPEKFPKDVPLLIMHGNADWRVKVDQSLRLAIELDKERVPFRLIIFEGGNHGLNEYREEVDTQAIQWFQKYLRDGKALPNMEYHGN
jgi:dipeptidyl aminopeptidase/acylaminoacyl peptidase